MFIQVKIELCTVLLSNYFFEICGSTFAHVNFTARTQDDNQAKKSLYFAELKFNPVLLELTECADDVETMCVSSVHNLDHSCFGMFVIVRCLFMIVRVYKTSSAIYSIF